MALFGGSKSTQTTDVRSYDQRVGLSDQATYLNAGAGANINYDVLSDDVAARAIISSTEASKSTLSSGLDFASKIFGETLQTAADALTLANRQVDSTRDFAGAVISAEQTTSDDRLIRIVTYGLAAIVASIALMKWGK